MYIPIASDDSGWGGPNLANPSDPNADVYFDWCQEPYGKSQGLVVQSEQGFLQAHLTRLGLETGSVRGEYIGTSGCVASPLPVEGSWLYWHSERVKPVLRTHKPLYNIVEAHITRVSGGV